VPTLWLVALSTEPGGTEPVGKLTTWPGTPVYFHEFVMT